MRLGFLLLVATLGLCAAACEHRIDVVPRVVEQSTPYRRRVEVPVLAPSAGHGAAAINAYFADRLESEYACPADADMKEASYLFTAKVAVVRGSLLGVVTEFDASCGGLHPDSGTAGLFFDLRTGALVDLLSLIKGERRAVLVRQYLARAEKADAECAWLLAPEALADAAFNFVPRAGALEVSPQLPYAMRACANAARFSWAEFESLADLSRLQ